MQGFCHKFAVNLGFIVNNFRPFMDICIGLSGLWRLGVAKWNVFLMRAVKGSWRIFFQIG
jgi:hypothetical protein